jgi:hypothetical protein
MGGRQGGDDLPQRPEFIWCKTNIVAQKYFRGSLSTCVCRRCGNAKPRNSKG